MSVATRVESLKSRHHRLESLISDEASRPFPDDLRLHELKREKLFIKDELLEMQGRLRRVS